MLTVGLTGGVAAGKSTVRKYFAELGAETFDADLAVHELLGSRTPEYKKVVARFGRGILMGTQIDRRLLRERVIKDRAALAYLERTLHPGVRRLLVARIRALKQTKGVFVAEVPLLFETRFDKHCARTIAVIAPLETQLRNGRAKKMDADDIGRFSDRQWTQGAKGKKADVVIKNNSTLASLKRKARLIYERLAREAGLSKS